jgi:hypothetical protein
MRLWIQHIKANSEVEKDFFDWIRGLEKKALYNMKEANIKGDTQLALVLASEINVYQNWVKKYKSQIANEIKLQKYRDGGKING